VTLCPLIRATGDGLQERFHDIIMKDLLIRSVQAVSKVDETSSPEAAEASIEPVDDSLFSFMNESSSHSTNSDAVTAKVDKLSGVQLN